MFSEERRNNTCLMIALGCLAAALAAACLVIIVAAGVVALGRERQAAALATSVAFERETPLPTLVATAPPAPPTPPPTATATVPKLSPTPSPGAGSGDQNDVRTDVGVAEELTLEEETLATLYALDVPPHDYFETAVRIGNHDVGERTVTGVPYVLGDDRLFQTDNGVIRATLRAVTEHAYFWVEDDVAIDEVALAIAADRFEREFYPAISNLFGEEWRPGIDNDPHFSILHLRDFGTAEDLGFFSASDEYPRSINSESNEQEIIYLNLRYLDIGEELYYGVLVHELEHLIHWNVDPNETRWLDEALAQLGEAYLEFDSVTSGAYLRRTETPLNRWAEDDEDAGPHYAGAYLFGVYFWEQLGDAAVQRLARDPADGLRSVRNVLAEFRPSQALEQFLADWAVANYLDDASAGTTYDYETLELRRPNHSYTVAALPFDKAQSIAPFGVHYVDVDVTGPVTISFTGDSRVPLIPVPPRGGQRMWLARGADNSNARMTADFDLTNVTSASFDFWAWYDLEPDWDYAYLSASADGGETWTLLVPDHAAAGLYGPAYNGRSADAPDAVGGWVQESISLNAYAGDRVLLRFDVLTDASVPSLGFAVDDITLKAAGYTGTAEEEDTWWLLEGFARAGQFLPQRWSVQLLQESSTTSAVTPLALDATNRGSWTFDLGPEGGVLVITPQTPFTRSKATYQLAIDAP